ncbi:uncharacterized protein LOC116163275 isoform X2 [Photinus pyralis]|uniref:uncharacterized protein LOC116163275 isoform X2 n=1 Tax=Photinus pyralis TaxID=7054 RepID=UPI00126738F4|nr:uncharacterized protein LOC116163275 isoform X2 [Photinus pyralis]
MSKSITNLKVFVSDEVLNLRLVDIDQLPKLKDIDDIPLGLNRKSDIKYNDVCLLDCLKSKRHNQKARSRAVDARIRRSHSLHRRVCTTQSSETLGKPVDMTIKKSSSSTPTVNKESCENENQLETPTGRSFIEGEDISTKPNYGEVLNAFESVEREVDYDDLNSFISEDETIKGDEKFKPYWEDPRYTPNSNNITVDTLPLLPNLSKYSGQLLCKIAPPKNLSYKYDQESDVCSCSVINNGYNRRYLEQDFPLFYHLLCSLISIIIASCIFFFIHTFRWDVQDFQKENKRHGGVLGYLYQIPDYLLKELGIGKDRYHKFITKSQRNSFFLSFTH